MDNVEQDEGMSNEDIRAALREMKGYLDITESDLKKVYDVALRHAKARLATAVPVREVMTKNVISVTEDTDVFEAARVLSENRISGMPVTDPDKHVLGVLTETDILRAAGMGEHHTFKDVLRRVLGDPLPKQENTRTARDFMSTPAITTTPNSDIRAAAKLMNERHAKRLPVVDDDNRLVGIISKADVVRIIGNL